MAEAAIVKTIQKTLTDRGAWHFKTHGGGLTRSGIPDIAASYKGRFLALEVKQPGNYPTRLQKHELDRAHRAGAIAAVVRSRDDVDHLLNQIDREMRPID